MNTLVTIVYHVNARHDGCADGIGSAWGAARHLYATRPAWQGVPIKEFYDRVDFIEGRISDLNTPEHLFQGKFKSMDADEPIYWIIEYVDCCPAYTHADLLSQIMSRAAASTKVSMVIRDHHATNKPVMDRFLNDAQKVDFGCVNDRIVNPLWVGADFSHTYSAALMCDRMLKGAVYNKISGNNDALIKALGMDPQRIPYPGLATFLSDYDTWEHMYPSSEIISHYVKSSYDAWTLDTNRKYSELFADFDRLENEIQSREWKVGSVEDVSALPTRVLLGWTAFLQIRSVYIAKKLSQAVAIKNTWSEFSGKSQVAGSCVYVYADSYPNELAAALLSDHSVLAVFVLLPQANHTVKVSGRSRKFDGDTHTLDVSDVARHFSGGGHKSAAGFTVNMNRHRVYRNGDEDLSTVITVIQSVVEDFGWNANAYPDTVVLSKRSED